MTTLYGIRQKSTGDLLPVMSTEEHSRDSGWVRLGYYVGWSSDTAHELVFVTGDRDIAETLLRYGAYERGSPGREHGFIQTNFEDLYDAVGEPIDRSDLEVAVLTLQPTMQVHHST